MGVEEKNSSPLVLVPADLPTGSSDIARRTSDIARRTHVVLSPMDVAAEETGGDYNARGKRRVGETTTRVATVEERKLSVGPFQDAELGEYCVLPNGEVRVF